MYKTLRSIALAALAAAMVEAPAAAAIGPDAPACAPGSRRPALLVRVDGFKNRIGTLRINLYGNSQADFLQRGKKIRRIDIPVTRAGAMPVCVALPAPGIYAVAVRHDADANNKTGWNDGGAYSRNPHLTIMDLKPKLRDAAVSVGNGVRPIDVRLNYRQGLRIAPIGG
jgi:uncharacterized protein (DUF2141 family)